MYMCACVCVINVSPFAADSLRRSLGFLLLAPLAPEVLVVNAAFVVVVACVAFNNC